MDSTGNPGRGGNSSLNVGSPIVTVIVSVVRIVVEKSSVEVKDLVVVSDIDSVELMVVKGTVVVDVWVLVNVKGPEVEVVVVLRV